VGAVRRLDTVRERYPTAALAQLTPDLIARLGAEQERET
ncbi:glutamate racemase, partial [Micrococcus endophyticus]